MKVAIYVRVSRTDQILENQINPLVEYCKRMNYDYEIFKEKESTRKTRPIQWDLYNRLLRKEFDGLIIYKFDRWARSTKELVEHMETLFSKNVMVYSYTENIDLSTSMGKAMLTILSAFAQLERDIIRERTLAGLARARAQGKKLGRPKKKRGYVFKRENNSLKEKNIKRPFLLNKLEEKKMEQEQTEKPEELKEKIEKEDSEKEDSKEDN